MAHNSSERLRVGIIGFGRRGILQAALVNMFPQAELAAICDTDAILLDHVRKFKPDCCVYNDLEEMFNSSRLDAVFICTPHHSHRPLAQKAVENGLHVFVERPLAESLISGREMMAFIQNKDLVCTVGYTLPFCPVFQEAKRLLDRGPLETIKRVRASLYHSLLTRPREGWMFENDQSGGGVLMHAASSLLFLLIWYFGPVDTVYAKNIQKFGEIEDSASILLEFRSGTLGYADISWSRPGYPRPSTSLVVEGTQGTMDVNDDTLKLFMYKADKGLEKGWTIQHHSDFPASTHFYLGEDGAPEANGNFIDSCLNRTHPRISWQEGLDVVKLVEAVYLSARTDKAIRLDEV